MTVAIRAEHESDRDAIWQVNQKAFGGDAEANLVNALRGSGHSEASLVAETESQIVGHLLFSRIRIVTNVGKVDALSLAPMAVLPSHQRQRIGSKLIILGLSVCRARGHGIVLVLGDPAFYQRFGFSSELAQSLVSPFGGGDAWMALELVPGSLADIKGSVEYSSPFDVFR